MCLDTALVPTLPSPPLPSLSTLILNTGRLQFINQPVLDQQNAKLRSYFMHDLMT